MPDVQVSAKIEFPQYSLAWIQKVCQQFVFLKHTTYPEFNINQIYTLVEWKLFDLVTSGGIHYVPPSTAGAFQTELGRSASGKSDLPSAVNCPSQNPKSESRECNKIVDILCNEVFSWCKFESLLSNTEITKSESNKRASEISKTSVDFKEDQRNALQHTVEIVRNIVMQIYLMRRVGQQTKHFAIQRHHLSGHHTLRYFP